MRFATIALSLSAAVLCVSTAQAAIITFTQQNVWEGYSVFQGKTVITETFNGISDGFYASPYSGTTGPVNWTASANGGIYVQSGFFSTNNPETLNFDFGAGVAGVAGNFFATDINFNVVPAFVYLTLNDGTSYLGYIDSQSAYTGFYSTGALITGLQIQATQPGGTVYPTVDNMQFAVVPAPSALALLALAGAARRRRR
ncbi:MAG: hypothetical protein QM516_11335 [Limnohabitans sp.]|nr:hypothetical protein [Limnohabitans sp.]